MTAMPLANLIDDHAAALTLYARQWCASPEDVVQAAFCKLSAQRTPPNDAVAWLFRVVRNAGIDWSKAERRRAKRERTASKPVGWFAEASIDGLDANAAIHALDLLLPELREVIVARLWGGLTLEQVSLAVGCSPSTAHRRYEAGIVALRERLGVECPKT